MKRLKEEKLQIAEELKQLDRKLVMNNEEKENLEATSAEPTSLLSMISPMMMADMIKLDELHRSISQKSNEVEKLMTQVPKNIPKMKLEDAQVQRKAYNENFKELSEKEKCISEQVNEFKNLLMNTREELNVLISKRNQYQEKMQGIDRLKEQFKEMKSEIADLEEKLKNSQSKFKPIQDELSALLKKKQHVRDANDKKINEMQKLINELKIDENEIDRFNKEIKMYDTMNLEQAIHQASIAVRTEQENMKKLADEMEKREEEVQEIRDNLNKGAVTLFNIQNNIDLLTLEDDVNEELEKFKKLKKEMNELDHKKMAEEKKRILNEIDRISKQRSMLSGQETQLEERIKIIEKELKEKKYVDAKTKYFQSVTHAEVINSTIDDLKKFTNSLEKSLLKYHQEKMAKINTLLKELWNSIYKGNDIDYIMIKTDEEDATDTDKRRTYNYRVMQSKMNGDLTEMRGRCSAGQKVLSSLIIRIALADTFSSECGILALDEPTTNLDQANIKSLSEALSEIVAQRSDGKFMLIVITHDEAFVRNLENAEKYYKISRNGKGLSVINEIPNY